MGNLVYLKIQPYKQMTLANTSFHKLASRYYGPCRILERTGTVTYKLEHPTGIKIHDVFHVSLLKKHLCDHIVYKDLPVYTEDGSIQLKPVALLDKRMKKANRPITEVLIQWQHTNPEDAVWRELHQL